MLKVSSPGRINIIGDHTDYNAGFVLPASINKGITVSIQKNNHPSHCKIYAKNVDEYFEFNLEDFRPIPSGWPNYIMGVVAELQKLGASLSGFEASFHGNVPIGSGMSSSAALECSFALSLNELFQLNFDRITLVKAAQMAEHHFAGMKCGIMDQFASLMGRAGKVMLLDCRSLDYQFFPIELGQYELLLLNTKVTHSLADSAYNKRRQECEKGVQIIQQTYPEVQQLRDVNILMLNECLQNETPLIYERCFHVVTENQRVLDACKALQHNDLPHLGQLLYASHESLSKAYEVSCPELDFLVDYTKHLESVLGARMMGGGFGGCTINLLKKEYANEFIEQISKAYYNQFQIHLEAYPVDIANGASVLENQTI